MSTSKLKTAGGIRVYCSHDKIVNIDELKPNPDNPNQHPAEQIDLLAKIIQENGWRDRIVVSNLSGMIVKGHGRYQAAVLAGLGEVPVEYQDYESVADEVRDLIADNKIAELSEVDDNAARALIESLDDYNPGEINLSGFGFTDDEVINLFPDTTGGESPEDEIPEVDEEPVTKPGDLYLLGNHRLLCGDATKREDVERLMGGQKADMVFTDPPYSVNYEKKNTEILKSKSYSKIKNDDLSVDVIAKTLWKPAFDNMAGVSKDGASIYTTMPQGGDQMMMMMMMMDSWQVKHELIWLKESPVFSMGRLDYDYMHEPILYGWKKNHKFFGGGPHKKSVWNIKRDGNKQHPTMKPVELIVNAILNSSAAGQLVLDTLLGSGSTLIASEKTNRICYGLEIDPYYCDVIVKRWEDYTGNKAQLV